MLTIHNVHALKVFFHELKKIDTAFCIELLLKVIRSKKVVDHLFYFETLNRN
jgi:hypothetical protein